MADTGRPLKFATVEDLETRIQAYFDSIQDSTYIDSNGNPQRKPLTITGLALALDTSRKVLMEYQERDAYSNTVKRAKTVIENYAEERLFSSSPTGAIFALKNYGWKDKSEQETINTNINKDVEPDSDLDQAILDRYFQKKGKE